MNPYSSDIEQQMLRFYRSLNEKDRRRYAAIEAAVVQQKAVGIVYRV